ncbi:MAG: hypothetical protein Q9161_006975 [Pseudevernia consocians]
MKITPPPNFLAKQFVDSLRALRSTKAHVDTGSASRTLPELVAMDIKAKRQDSTQYILRLEQSLIEPRSMMSWASWPDDRNVYGMRPKLHEGRKLKNMSSSENDLRVACSCDSQETSGYFSNTDNIRCASQAATCDVVTYGKPKISDCLTLFEKFTSSQNLQTRFFDEEQLRVDSHNTWPGVANVFEQPIVQLPKFYAMSTSINPVLVIFMWASGAKFEAKLNKYENDPSFSPQLSFAEVSVNGTDGDGIKVA